MKSVTEFPSFVLDRALKAKNTLAAQGKTPEEIQANLGETFKLEGDKLKYFTNALEVASQNSNNLKRVLVVSLNEGENAPAKATQFEEMYYVPEFNITARPAEAKSENTGHRGGGRGGRGGGGRGGGAPKGSPWGMTPEEKAAKAGNKAAAKPAKT